LAPTFLELAGAVEAPHFEGRSIADMIKGVSSPSDRALFWEHEGNRAVRKGDWKLVELASSANGWELYDLGADRTEQQNLAAQRPELVAELTAEYDLWAERCGVVPWNEIAPHKPTSK
jgi:arylsulfatase